MQKLIALFMMSVVALNTYAQTERNPFPKTITVNGTAEIEVVPDQIFVQVDLKEYDKKGTGKVGIDKIKADFLKHVRSMRIADSLITIAAYDGYNGNPWLRKKNKKEELYAGIAYQLKLTNSRQVDELVNGLDDEATRNFFIQRTAHSQLEAYRKQLKIEAVKAAREKAGYLTAALDEKVGEAVTINEPVEYYVPYYNARTANVMMKERAESMDNATDTAPVDFTKLKLKYDVTVVFAIK